MDDDESISLGEIISSQHSDSGLVKDRGTSVILEDEAPSGHQHRSSSPAVLQASTKSFLVAPARFSDTEDDSSNESDSTFESALQCHIDCLMDLIPTLEKSLAHIESQPHITYSARPSFSVSEAALPFVLQVHDKFPTAPTKLVERLGESNWQRYVTLRNGVQCREETEETAPSSVFVPELMFHDSGIGTSMASTTQQAISVASHTTFISSHAEEGHTSLRVPTTPPEVALGKPFKCEVCSEVLHTIKNRIDWK